MNILKLLIPSGTKKEIQEIESFTVRWGYKTGFSDNIEYRAKVFINKVDAEEFQQQLIVSADFIGCYLTTKLYKN